MPLDHTPHDTPFLALVSELVAAVDLDVRAAERRWGCGRLRLLVPEELRARFDGANAMWEASWRSMDAQHLRDCAAMIRRAWAALEDAAQTAGHQPLAPVVWEAGGLPGGATLALVRDPAEAPAVAHQAREEGREIEVWTLADVVHLVARNREVGAVLRAFPGAQVSPEAPQRPLEGETSP